MDPNEALRELREKTQRAMQLIDSTDSDRCGYSDMLSEVSELFNGLDGWLSSDGFLPDAWFTGSHRDKS